MSGMADVVVLWMPPDREHALALSLGLVDLDRDELAARIEAARADIAANQPGIRVVVHRHTCSEVVAWMSRLGMRNTSEGRAAAFGALSIQP